MLHHKSLLSLTRLLVILTCVSPFFTGCRALTYKDPEPAYYSSKGLRTELDQMLKRIVQGSDQMTATLNRLIPQWHETDTLLKKSVHHVPQIADHYKRMRNDALKELPWALQVALEAGLTEIKIHRVGLHSGRRNAHGDIALLAHLKSHNGLYTVTLHRPDDEQGLRLSGWVYQHGYGWRCLLKLGEYLDLKLTGSSTSP